jgi:arylsulfatase A-like enzyme
MLPKKVVVVLLDSLNRHDLGCYGGRDFDTPNLDRFASQHATRFTNHVTGSLPCMPARHDILCGSLDFLWRPWGSIELWEEPITNHLRRAGIPTMLVSDHPHLFEIGGENYHTDFLAWDYVRGNEDDPWKTFADESAIGAPSVVPSAMPGTWFADKTNSKLRLPRAYDTTRTYFREETDFPGPRTMRAAANWLSGAAKHHDQFMLFVDEFDPHEPFDVPQQWANRYDPDWNDDLIIWPPYDVGAIKQWRMTEREGRHIRANYGAKVTMIDHWFGEILRTLTDNNMWDDTAVIVCTDHGHYLGDERNDLDIWGKPGVPQYEPLGHTPLLIHWPGNVGGEIQSALTTNVDLFATLCDMFNVTPNHVTHGKSLVPLLNGTTTSVRDWALGGVFGNWVQITDGRMKYARGASETNYPLSMWSNRWSTMPVYSLPGLRLPKPDRRATIDFMPGSDVPVLRQPFAPGDPLPLWVGRGCVDSHYCFDLSNDPNEQENRVGSSTEVEMIELLRVALRDLEAPQEQFDRLGVA